MPAYMNALTAESLRFLKRIPENVRIFQNGSPFQLGRFQVEAFSLSHDAVDPVGFIIHCDDRKIAIATDFGYAGKMVPLKMYNADIIILESNHEPELLRRSKRPPKIQHRIHGRRGHLSNPSAAALLQQIVGPLTRQLVMVHLSRDCNHPNLVKDRMQSSLQCLERNDIDLHIAEQDKIVKTVLD